MKTRYRYRIARKAWADVNPDYGYVTIREDEIGYLVGAWTRTYRDSGWILDNLTVNGRPAKLTVESVGDTDSGYRFMMFIDGRYVYTFGVPFGVERASADRLDQSCVFCDIVAGEDESVTLLRWWDDAVAFVPLNPVTPGHLLVVPKRHVADVGQDPEVTAAVMRAAGELATSPCNLITSAGPEATQTVFHLHVHVVPRRAGDGLCLPWTGQKREG